MNVHPASSTASQGQMEKISHGTGNLFQVSPSRPLSAVAVSCLIPAYNEGANIWRVLEVVHTLSFLDEIIILDDGSSDNTAEVAREYQKKNNAIKLIASPANCGKTATIRKGVAACRGELVVILDADLINLQPDDVLKLIAAVAGEAYDLAILDRAGDRKAIWGWTDCARFFGGERAFRKQDFLQIGFQERGGFLLEIAMNLDYIRRRKTIRTIFCANLFTMHHYDKRGLREGFRHYWQIAGEILAFSGVIDFLKQVYHIEEDRLARLYNWQKKIYLKPATFLLIPLAGLVYGWLTFLKLNLAGRGAAKSQAG